LISEHEPRAIVAAYLIEKEGPKGALQGDKPRSRQKEFVRRIWDQGVKKER